LPAENPYTADIESIVLAQSNGIPVQLKHVASVSVGYVPRLGKAGRDNEDDVVAAIVVMNRTLHTNDVVPHIEAAVEKLNVDGTLPPGVKLVPFYDRSIFGCLLVFLIQWTFLGDLRSAIIVGVNIPFALFFSIIILVLLGQDANLLSIGAVDFGIIIDSAVILVENIFRNFQAPETQRRQMLQGLAAGRFGAPPTEGGSGSQTWTNRLRLIYISAVQVDKAVLFSTAVTVAAFVPLLTMQGVEGQIFNPMARTYGFALCGALVATFTVPPVLASLLLPEHIREAETGVVRALRTVYTPILRLALSARKITVTIGPAFLMLTGILTSRLGTEFLPHLEEGNLWIRASMPPTISLEAGMKYVTKMRRCCSATRKSSPVSRSMAAQTMAAMRRVSTIPNSLHP
jgi:heavy metal efflux system protein